MRVLWPVEGDVDSFDFIFVGLYQLIQSISNWMKSVVQTNENATFVINPFILQSLFEGNSLSSSVMARFLHQNYRIGEVLHKVNHNIVPDLTG